MTFHRTRIKDDRQPISGTSTKNTKKNGVIIDHKLN